MSSKSPALFKTAVPGQIRAPRSPRRQKRSMILSLTGLVISLIYLLGCTSFASTAVILTVADNRLLDDPGQAGFAGPAAESSAHLPRPYPGQDTPLTTTLTLAPPSDTGLVIEPPVASPEAGPVEASQIEAAQFQPPPDMPEAGIGSEQIEHVVLISIDGLRPDALELAHTPTLDGLRAAGAYSPQAQTINPSFTLPAHVSMLTGVTPQKHGIFEALPCIGCPLSLGPTLFGVAHEAGLSTGMVTGKEKLDYLVLPDTIDSLFCAEAHDPVVKDKAVEFIRAGLPNMLFIHFPDTDRVGHAYGWMSENQLYAVNYADTMIGEIVAELETSGYLARTLLIITSDHGGHGFKHGDDSPVDRTVPWLAVGPGVPQGVILSSPINILDNAATAAYALDLPLPERWDGRPVLEIFESR